MEKFYLCTKTICVESIYHWGFESKLDSITNGYIYSGYKDEDGDWLLTDFFYRTRHISKKCFEDLFVEFEFNLDDGIKEFISKKEAKGDVIKIRPMWQRDGSIYYSVWVEINSKNNANSISLTDFDSDIKNGLNRVYNALRLKVAKSTLGFEHDWHYSF